MSVHFPDMGPGVRGVPAASAELRIEHPYTFRIYPARNLVCLTISGFWNEAMVDSFAIALREAIGALGREPGEHRLCCDVSFAAIQSQDVIKRFQALIAAGPTHAHKLALWTSRPLSRMQSRRLLAVRDNIAVFDAEEEALRWLAD
ncbi:hypothetical protein U1872_18305 [Sphingomonas sp. RB3P16]|uniref:hypothetical protein n=1 Tax=Parasphingomonas frigoris TaxID=3096163 RepID=UPI002FCC0808